MEVQVKQSFQVQCMVLSNCYALATSMEQQPLKSEVKIKSIEINGTQIRVKLNKLFEKVLNEIHHGS